MISKQQLKRILFIPDVHAPYHDQRAWNLMMQLPTAVQFDVVIINGDFPDFYAVSDHSKDPKRVKQLLDELRVARRLLGQLAPLFKQKIYVYGNHEDRLDRYLMNRAPELWDVIREDDLLRLKKDGWVEVPYRDHVEVGKLYITHDVGVSGKTSVDVALAAYQDNIITGHTHRLKYIVEGNAKGHPHVSASFGWLGDVKQIDYMHRIRAARDWALGFGVGYMEANGVVHVQPVPIIDYKVVFEGRLYTEPK